MTAIVGPGLFAFGIPGPRELFLVGLVVLALYGRSGMLKTTRTGRAVAPWVDLVKPWTRSKPSPGRGQPRPAPAARASAPFVRNRWFWALALTAAAAVASLVATRLIILNHPGGTP